MNLFTLSLWILTCLLTSGALASDYYVDSAGGSDAGDGRSEASAWGTLDRVNRTDFAPGDRVFFRGEFRGVIRLSDNTNGSPGNPVVFDGESWGGTKTRMMATVPWKPAWTRCTQAFQAAGNPNFGNIWYADAPPDWSPNPADDHFFKPIFENGDFLWFSTEPNPVDPFQFEDPRDLRSLPPSHFTSSAITDPGVFTQSDPSFYDGAYIGMRDNGNLYVYNLVQSFDPAGHTIRVAGSWSPRDDSLAAYNILNHLAFLDRPGEYVYKPGEHRIYIWPKNSGDPNANAYEAAHEVTGFEINGRSNITVRGFHFEGLHSLPGGFNNGVAILAMNAAAVSTNLLIENNTITKLRDMKYSGAIRLYNCQDSIVQNNTVEYGQNAIGVLAENSSNILIRGNRIDRVSKLGIWFQSMRNSAIVSNTLQRIQGVHSNGITCYLNCADILIAGNRIWQTENPITLKDSSNLYIIGNLLDGIGAYSIAEWSGNMSGDIMILNNTAVNAFASEDSRDSNASIYLNNASQGRYVVINNVLDGLLVDSGEQNITRSHNVYSAVNHTQRPERGWAPHNGEQVSAGDLNRLLTDTTHGNYSPAANSPLIDSGLDVRAYHPVAKFPQYDFSKDLDGNPVGAVFNIGAYEGPGQSDFTPSAPTPTPPQPVTQNPSPQAPAPTPTVTPTPSRPGAESTVVQIVRGLSGSPNPGEWIDVSLTLTINNQQIDMTISEAIPQGWTFESADPQATIQQKNEIHWHLQNAEPMTLTYRLRPSNGNNNRGIFYGSYSYPVGNEYVQKETGGEQELDLR